MPGASKTASARSRVDPLEQGEVEDELPVGVGERAPEAPGDPAADGVAHGRRLGRGRPRRRVAARAQRDRPALGLGGDGAELPPREREAEEPGDVRRGEAQVVCGEDPRVEDARRGVEARRQRPVGERQAQARRGVAEHAVEDGDRVAVGEPLELVEREHDGAGAALEGAQEDGAARRHPAGGRPPRPQLGVDVDAGPPEGEGEVGVEGRRIVVVEGEPGNGHAGARGRAAGGRQGRGLAEAARRHERGDGPADGVAAGGQLRAAAVAVRGFRNGGALGEQPPGGGVPAAQAEGAGGRAARRRRRTDGEPSGDIHVE